MSDNPASETNAPAVPAKPLGEAAKRALAEAEERRRQARDEPRPREFNGRGGPDPARYGDWEVKGHAVDF